MFSGIRKGFDMKDALLILTSCASVFGIILLKLSIVNAVQIRIIVYACGSVEARRTIWALCTIIAIALVIYVMSINVSICALPDRVPGHCHSSNKGINNAETDSAVQVLGLT
ncbi:hypothetical protein OROMI_003497 [Orobanche minor]